MALKRQLLHLFSHSQTRKRKTGKHGRLQDFKVTAIQTSRIHIKEINSVTTSALQLVLKARNVYSILQIMHTLYCFIIYTQYVSLCIYWNKLHFLVLQYIFSRQPKFLLSFFKFIFSRLTRYFRNLTQKLLQKIPCSLFHTVELQTLKASSEVRLNNDDCQSSS